MVYSSTIFSSFRLTNTRFPGTQHPSQYTEFTALTHSPRLVSASDHSGWVSFAALIVRGVYKLEDVGGTKLEGGSGVQHGGLVDTLPVHQGVCVRPVGGDRHQPLAVHQVAVMREEARTKQLGQEVKHQVEERIHSPPFYRLMVKHGQLRWENVL